MGDTPHNLTEHDFKELGDGSEGYSGSDISVMVREALMEPLRMCQTATHFVRDEHGMFSPSRLGEPGAQLMSLMDVPDNMLQVPDVTMVRVALAPLRLGRAALTTAVASATCVSSLVLCLLRRSTSGACSAEARPPCPPVS